MKKQECCFDGCDNEAEFEIIARRPNGQPAGPNRYSDDTFSCVKHVGVMLGYQPDAVEVEEIEWLVTQCNNEVKSKHLMDLTTVGR